MYSVYGDWGLWLGFFGVEGSRVWGRRAGLDVGGERVCGTCLCCGKYGVLGV